MTKKRKCQFKNQSKKCISKARVEIVLRDEDNVIISKINLCLKHKDIYKKTIKQQVRESRSSNENYSVRDIVDGVCKGDL